MAGSEGTYVRATKMGWGAETGYGVHFGAYVLYQNVVHLVLTVLLSAFFLLHLGSLSVPGLRRV